MVRGVHGRAGAAVNSTLDFAIREYVQFMRAAGRSPATVHVVGVCLNVFRRFSGPVTIEQAASQAIPFLAERSQYCRRNTLCAYSAYLRGFFRFCVRHKWLEESPFDGMPSPKPEKVVTQPLTDHEILALYEAGDQWTRPMLVLLLGSGMRIGELASLRWSDVRDGQVTVRGKGAKQRTLAPGGRAMAALYALPRDGDWVFPFTCNGAKERLKRLSRHTGIAFHPHQLRHSFSDRFLRAGGSIEELSEILGHASLNTTAIYVAAYRRERALESQRRLNPADALFSRRQGGVSAARQRGAPQRTVAE